MPNKDRTGPEGKGPRTGGQRGLCGTHDVEIQSEGRGARRGLGRGNAQRSRDGRGQRRGRGLGLGRRQ